MSLFSDIDKLLSLIYDLISIVAVVVRAIGIAFNLEFFPVMATEKAQHQMRCGVIMKITGKVADGKLTLLLPPVFNSKQRCCV